MGSRIEDATVYIAPDDTIGTTSSDYHALTISGDTIQIATDRTPSSGGAAGNKGEICWGHVTTLGITTYYLYICIAANTWRRVALSSF